MHKTSGHWKKGCYLSLITATLWGMLPIALKGLLDTMDSVTITWYRFFVSVILIGIILYKKKRLPNLKWLKNRRLLPLFIVVIAGLCSNYVLYIMGLNLVTPSAAQIVIQIAPLLLLIGGVIIFKESFSKQQWFGVLVFIIGLGLFFNQRFDIILNAKSDYSWGLLLVSIAAIAWAAYALAQKQLLLHYGSQQIMFITYVAAIIIFLPGSSLLSVSQLTAAQWFLLTFSCINTVIAYGCFAEALEHWEASRVAAVLAITPLLTILFAYFTNQIFPQYIPLESINIWSVIGAVILVVGSLTAALAKKRDICE
jgi:drug/metabolite transporter (DMT)-like permease